MRGPAERNVFRCEGEYWTIVFDAKTVRLRDSKGMRYLATLLRRRGEEIPSLELYAAASPVVAKSVRIDCSPEQARIAVTKGLKTALERIEAVHPSLAAHLEATLRRGSLCRYRPDPRHPITWEE
jgi:hypothetical protein